jgi:hypothetical protein
VTRLDAQTGYATDPDFGDRDLDHGFVDFATDVDVTPEGRLLVAGAFNDGRKNPNTRGWVMRLDGATGLGDPGFGDDGTRTCRALSSPPRGPRSGAAPRLALSQSSRCARRRAARRRSPSRPCRRTRTKRRRAARSQSGTPRRGPARDVDPVAGATRDDRRRLRPARPPAGARGLRGPRALAATRPRALRPCAGARHRSQPVPEQVARGFRELPGPRASQLEFLQRPPVPLGFLLEGPALRRSCSGSQSSKLATIGLSHAHRVPLRSATWNLQSAAQRLRELDHRDDSANHRKHAGNRRCTRAQAGYLALGRRRSG